MASNYLKADLILLTVTFVAAGGWIFSKEALVELPPLLFVGMRFLLAGIVLAIVGANPLYKLSAKLWIKSVGIGLLFALAMLFWIQGLYNAEHIGEGAFITSMGIVLVPIIAYCFFKERPTKETWIALPISIAGLAFLSLNKPFSLEAGQWYFLIAAVFFAVQFTVVSGLVNQIPPISLTAIQLIVVGLAGLVTSSITEEWPQDVSSPIWGWFLASALIATSLRFWLQTKGQSFAPASHAVLILTLEPVWTALLASIWFEERMTLLQLTGCIFIFSALIVSRWRWVKAAFSK